LIEAETPVKLLLIDLVDTKCISVSTKLSPPTGEQITLTKKEMLLLKLLIERKGEVVSRKQILEKVWGYDIFPSTRTIDNFILSFRKYFEPNPREPKYFLSIRSVGYQFEPGTDAEMINL
jgi:two-component system, OmpR family, alkaline phosphatase synthesis response regulator PhoP